MTLWHQTGSPEGDIQTRNCTAYTHLRSSAVTVNHQLPGSIITANKYDHLQVNADVSGGFSEAE
jgi:hypothetical protein